MRAISIETYDTNGLLVPSADGGSSSGPLFIETYDASGLPVGLSGGAGGITGVADGGTGSDLSATGPGHLIQASVGAVITVLKHNLAASAAPAVTDDSSAGYGVGSLWVDTTNDRPHVCTDPSPGNAVWNPIPGFKLFGTDSFKYYADTFLASQFSFGVFGAAPNRYGSGGFRANRESATAGGDPVISMVAEDDAGAGTAKLDITHKRFTFVGSGIETPPIAYFKRTIDPTVLSAGYLGLYAKGNYWYQIDSSLNVNQLALVSELKYQTVKKAGSAATQRPNLNFIDGSNITITVADNSGTGATDVTVAASASGGTVDTTGTAGEDLAARDIVYLKASDSKWYKLDTDATATVKVSPLRGIVPSAIANAASGTIRLSGEVSGFTGLTAGGTVYGSTTAGGYTQTKPVPSLDGAQVCIVPIGEAISTTVVVVKPHHVYFAKRATLSNDEVLTIEHYTDAQERLRLLKAIASATLTGASAASYSETNQDSDVDLEYSIRDQLISWWALEEASGNRADSHGSNTLTDNNTVTSNPGKVNTAAQFTAANTEYLSHTDNADLSVSDVDFCFSLWVYLDSTGVARTILCKDGNTGNREHYLEVRATNVVRFFAFNGGTGQIGVVSSVATLSASTWYHLYVYHDSVNNKVGISIDNGAAVEAATTGAPGNGAAPFEIGDRSSGTAPFNGRIDEVAFWKGRLLTAAERTWLYNSGSGRSYADSAPIDKLAQSFQMAGSTTINQVRLYLKKTGAPTGTMTLRIETDSAGSPSGTLADASATVTVAESSLAASYGYITFDFATNFTLSGSTTYWLVLSTDRAGDYNDFIYWGADGSSPGYASGEMKSHIAAWAALTKDAVFDVMAEGTTYEEPRVIGAWSGGTRDIAVKMLDGSDANGDTNTSFKNVTGATLADATCIVELP